MVLFAVVVGRGVALGADAVARRAQLQAVRLVAVAADHTRQMHPALHEGAVDVDLVADLAVYVVGRRARHGQAVGVEQIGAVVVVAQGAAPRVTAPAAIYLRVRLQRPAAARDPAVLRHGPFTALRQIRGKAAAGCAGEGAIPGQRDMFVARPVTGFAADADFFVAGVEGAGVRVVVLAHIGAVTFGAAAVPVLVGPGPVQRVFVVDDLVRIQVKPALTAPRRGARVPGDRQRLQSAPVEGQQVLLQRVHAEDIGHFEFRRLAILAVGAHQVVVAPAKKTRRHAVAGERGVVEIAEHGVGPGGLHCQLVMGAEPGFVFGAVAIAARGRTGESGRRNAVQEQRQGNQSDGWHDLASGPRRLSRAVTLAARPCCGQRLRRLLSWSALLFGPGAMHCETGYSANRYRTAATGRALR